MKKVFAALIPSNISTSSLRILPYVLNGFVCPSPKSIDIEISNRCNLHCQMCWFHGQNGVGDLYADQELTTNEIINIVDELSIYKPSIYIGGSEPFIRDDFLLILEHIKNHNMMVSFTTNGTLIDQLGVKKIVEIGTDVVNFSIDGHEALHDQVRGDGVFRKVTSVISELSKYKRKRCRVNPVINVNIIISPSMHGNLAQTIEELIKATDDGVDVYRLHHLWFITRSELKEHCRLVRQSLNCSARGAASHVTSCSENIKAPEIAKEILSLRDNPKVKLFPDLSYNNIINYYSNDPVDKKRCVAPFFGAVIKPNGDVRFCPDEWIDDYVLGNIRMDRFDSIWNNDKARKFRARLWKIKCFPGCKRCSWMY